MNKILILMGRYLPGYKDGGPLRTIANLVDLFGDEFEFYIACLDRDHGDTKPYPNIKQNVWNKVGKANVLYLKKFAYKKLKELSNYVDVIYCCGFYGAYGYKTLILKKHKKIKKPVYVAPMGTFSKGALKNKHFKKNIYIGLCNAFGLFKNIVWSVTSELEAKDLLDNIKNNPKYVIAEDLPRSFIPDEIDRNFSNNTFVFLSRISPMKNLLGAIQAIKNINCNLIFDIYGPIEDKQYWIKCETELKKMPSNITWKYCGSVPTEQVQNVLKKYNYFLFPTFGENYGHVIFEALSVGCIPIISNQTPWVCLEQNNIGCTLALSNDMVNFKNKIIEIIGLSDLQKKEMSDRAIAIAKQKVEQSKKDSGYIRIFKKNIF